MVGMHTPYRPNSAETQHSDDIEDGASLNLAIDLEDIDNTADSHSLRKLGLHGRARIWGPNRTMRMIFLTTALMGLQFTWSIEMAYGTPFLLQLGLSKSLMSLVWLAGPLSGLVMQPVVGVLSDRCTSKLGRRRPFLIVGVAAVVVSFLCLGWCRDIIRGIFGADYDNLENATILMAVGAIYILDFAINCVQASCRTLIVDSLPSSQQEAAASWASRLMGIGGIFGYFMGNVNLPQFIPAFGDTQIKGLCIIACLFLILTVGLTCLTVTERVMVRAAKTSGSSLDETLQGFKLVLRAIRYLPTRIQQLCNVQFFAWMGWFPFLFYSSTYIAEIYTREQTENGNPVEPDLPAGQDPVNGVQDAAVRAGSFCLLIYSIVSLGGSIILPLFVSSADQISTGSHGPFSNSRSTSASENELGSMKRLSRWRRLRLPRWLSLPIPGLTLPKMYTMSLALVSFALVSTWYIHDLQGSTILFACCGVAWAITMWAPFSILGEVISQQMQEEQHQDRLRGTGQSQRGEMAEVLYQKDDEGEGEDEGEEIRMSESGRGRQYQPVRARESLDEPVTVAESKYKSSRPGVSNADSFRNRTSTPSPAAVEGQSFAVGALGWTVSSDQDKPEARLDTNSETDATSDDNYESGDDDRRLVQKRSNHSRSSRCSSHSSHSHNGSTTDTRRSRTYSHEHRREQRNANGHGRGTGGAGRTSSRTSHSEPPSISAQSTVEVTSAGALLGIHNIYIVLPQFLVSFLSSLVFAAIEPRADGATEGELDQPGNPETIGVMLRIGGIMAGIAALLSLKLWKQPRTVAPL